MWQGGAGDGVASLVVFGGETITRTGQTAYMNDVWLYTPHEGAWREVRAYARVYVCTSKYVYMRVFVCYLMPPAWLGLVPCCHG